MWVHVVVSLWLLVCFRGRVGWLWAVRVYRYVWVWVYVCLYGCHTGNEPLWPCV